MKKHDDKSQDVTEVGKVERAGSNRLAQAEQQIGGKRRIIGVSGDQQVCLVLCDDGSVWKSQIYGSAEITWQQLPELPEDKPQDKPERQDPSKTVKGEGMPAIRDGD